MKPVARTNMHLCFALQVASCMKPLFAVILCLTLSLSAEKSIELFVALCDNKTQGIAKVGAKIGNGDDAANNLYWGCSDGAGNYFKRSEKWTLLETATPEAEEIIETRKFKHKASGTILIAHAYRGSRMALCLEHYFEALKKGGPDKLVAFIGHNGLMDSTPRIPEVSEGDSTGTPTIVLCCISDRFFAPHFLRYQAQPLLLTNQLMYPGAFILHDCIEVWLKDGKPAAYLEAAGRAYAKNQSISTKTAKKIFVAPNK